MTKFKFFLRQKKTPELGLGWGRVEEKLRLSIPGQKYMPGIGDQAPDTTKGLKAISSNVTIGICQASLNPEFVKICKQKNPQIDGVSYLG